MLETKGFYFFRTILRIDNTYFPKELEPVGFVLRKQFVLCAEGIRCFYRLNRRTSFPEFCIQYFT
jgi:hypothetical protein